MNSTRVGGPRGGKFLAEQAMSAGAPAQPSAGQFSPCTVAVLRALAGLANTRGECSPSMRDLVRATGFSANSVRKAVRRLERSGRLAVTPQFGDDGGRNANLYTMSCEPGSHVGRFGKEHNR